MRVFLMGKGVELCLAHVTNCMAQTAGDFEKGEADGSVAVLAILGRLAQEWDRR